MAENQKIFKIIPILFLMCFCVENVFAQKSTTSMVMRGQTTHVSANRSVRDMKTNREELFGNVYVRRPNELLTADYAIIHLNENRIIAEGNVVYFTPTSVIYGSKMDFDYTSGTGYIEDGRVETESYQLIGEQLTRLDEDEYDADQADYTTCKDCPSSWKIHGKNISLRVEGYARISHMLIKINESPLFYFPYLIVPVKSKRQTGFLFPKFKTGSIHGFQYIQPFFWAISRSQDLTLGLGKLTARGWKAESEYRYALGRRSFGKASGFFLNDRTFQEPYQKRWALETTHQWELYKGFELKLKWVDSSDRDYARQFPEDITGSGEPALVSEVGLSRADRDISFWVNAKRIKKLLTNEITGFDKKQVQEAPSVNIAATDHRFTKYVPLYWGLKLNYTQFWRDEMAADFLPGPKDARGVFVPGRDPLRKAHRFSLTPEIYYTAKIFDVVNLVPTVQYRWSYYLFDQTGVAPARRGYLLTSTRMDTTVEKVYGGSVKHKITPSLTYSVIPQITQDKGHPFTKQLDFGTGNVLGSQGGRQFDDHDIIPYSFDVPQYFMPQGHSLTYELHNIFIQKTKDVDSSIIPSSRDLDKEIIRIAPSDTYTYRKAFEVFAGHTINFVEYRKSNDEDQRPLFRAYLLASTQLKRLVNDTDMYYYPYTRVFLLNTSWTYHFARFSKRLMTFERNVSMSYSSQAHQLGLGFNWSLNDYLLVGFQRSIELKTGRVRSTMGRILFQSPSQCYQIALNIQKTLDRGLEISPTFVMNLAGGGFSNVTDANSAGNFVPSSGR